MKISDLTHGIQAHSGTAGDTLTTTTAGIIDSTIFNFGVFQIGIIVLLLGITAHLLDRKYTRPIVDKELKLMEEDIAKKRNEK